MSVIGREEEEEEVNCDTQLVMERRIEGQGEDGEGVHKLLVKGRMGRSF